MVDAYPIINFSFSGEMWQAVEGVKEQHGLGKGWQQGWQGSSFQGSFQDEADELRVGLCQRGTTSPQHDASMQCALAALVHVNEALSREVEECVQAAKVRQTCGAGQHLLRAEL